MNLWVLDAIMGVVNRCLVAVDSPMLKSSRWYEV